MFVVILAYHPSLRVARSDNPHGVREDYLVDTRSGERLEVHEGTTYGALEGYVTVSDLHLENPAGVSARVVRMDNIGSVGIVRTCRVLKLHLIFLSVLRVFVGILRVGVPPPPAET
jgi:hypothetical protein